ncbi:MAG: 1-aminocyclopropane-1-carboxylate deaminase/D-cysteine desulfhydrase [bacterium]
MEQPLIFKRFPQLAGRVPWIPLGKFPTPVEQLSNLGKKLGFESLWIKREDLSGEYYGGNKVRTLEYSLAEAKKKRTELIITYSALGSNWPLACVVYAKLQGLPTDVFYLPYPLDAIKEKNLWATRLLARRIFTAKSLLTFPFLLYFNVVKAKKSGRIFLMPPGGTSPRTTLGHINAVFELQQQHEQGEAPVPDYVFCPFGSGGTVAGLSIGFNLIEWPTKVMAVRVVDYIVANRFTLNGLVKRTLGFLRERGVALPPIKKWPRNIEIIHNCFGKGYAVPTPEGERCIELLKCEQNQQLDSTYTGKTFSAILHRIQRSDFQNKSILFWQSLNSRGLDELPGKLVRQPRP